MDYQLQLKPFKRQDGFKYKIIQITDITLHSSDKQPTKSIGKKVKQAFDSNKPGRIYGLKVDKSSNKSATSISLPLELLQKDPEFIKLIQEEEAKGYKILLQLPENGIPVIEGEDTVEFINSRKGKRILRRLAKKKRNELKY